MTDEQFDIQYYKELQEQRDRQKLEHRAAFNAWIGTQDYSLTDSAQGLSVGDRVTFTNDNGVVFPGHTVLAIDANEDGFYGRRFFLDYDCYWFPSHVNNLTKEG